MSTLGTALAGVAIGLWVIFTGLLFVLIWFTTGETFDKTSATALVVFMLAFCFTALAAFVEGDL